MASALALPTGMVWFFGLIVRNKVDYFSFGSHAAGSTNTMKVGFLVFSLIKVYNKVYILYMEATGSNIGCNKYVDCAILES